MTPQNRATKELESRGYIVDVVEQIKRAGPKTWRKDLFGGFDLLAVGGPNYETLAVQVTSRGNVSARLKKLADLPSVPYLRKAGWRLEVWGYGKTKTRGDWAIVDIS